MPTTKFLTKILLCSLSLNGVLSIPLTENGSACGKREDGGMSFPVTRNEEELSVSERLDREAAHIKARYGITNPDSSLARRSQGGSTAVPIRGNALYFMQLIIGGQAVNLNPDTGSAKFYAPSKQIAGNRGPPYSYDPKASGKGSCLSNSLWEVGFLSGATASGPVCFDEVRFPSNNVNVVDSGSTPVLFANKTSGVADNGILGLAKDPRQGFKFYGQDSSVPTFFQWIIPYLTQPLFTVDFQLGYNNGSVNFGYIDTSKTTSEVVYSTRYTDTDSWKIDYFAYAIGSKPYVATSKKVPFIIDTGASLMYLDETTVTSYWRSVPGATNVTQNNNGWNFPCNSPLPDLKLIINNKIRTTPGRYFNYGKNPDGTCYGALQNTFTTDGVMFFGDAWIRSQYLVFLNSSSTYPTGAVGIANKYLV